MARRIRTIITSRSNRLALEPRGKPYHFTEIAVGLSLGYRRTRRGAGRWVLRGADGAGGSWTKVLPGCADDHQDADPDRGILDWHAAQDKAREVARKADGDVGAPLTWAAAIDLYEQDLAGRGGRLFNAQHLRRILPPRLLAKPIALLTGLELRQWRDSLLARGLQPSTVTRECRPATASLNYARALDPKRIQNQDAWRLGLAALRGSRKARIQVLPDETIRELVAACYAYAPARKSDFGLLIELLAITGCRASQACRLQVGDLQRDRIMLPRSMKGKGKKFIDRRPFPLPANVIAKLKAAAGNRPAGEPLLRRADGTAWVDPHQTFAKTLVAAGLARVTPYCFRHSAIHRALMRGQPARLVADAHDTGVGQIEATYGHLIADHAEDVLRDGLIDLKLPRRRS